MLDHHPKIDGRPVAPDRRCSVYLNASTTEHHLDNETHRISRSSGNTPSHGAANSAIVPGSVIRSSPAWARYSAISSRRGPGNAKPTTWVSRSTNLARPLRSRIGLTRAVRPYTGAG